MKQRIVWVRTPVCLWIGLLLTAASMQAQTTTYDLSVDAMAVAHPIPHDLYGQFVEDFFGDVTGPLWDELIRNRGFEEAPDAIGLPRYWEREPDDRDHDPALKFAWDDSVALTSAINGESSLPSHSLRIDISNAQWDEAWPRGVSQKDVRLRSGTAYHGHLWICAQGFEGYVTVALGQDEVGGRTYASQNFPITHDEWTKYGFEFDPATEDHHAKFSILVHGRGRLWIDGVSLMPSDTVAGARAEVFDDIKALRPASIRWPGGNVAQDYHWMRGVGDRDARPFWVDHAWWKELHNSDFGTDEYLALCRELGTQPSILVNVEGDGATPEEAAAWVQYVNGPADSEYGSLRARNGHPAPYHVRLWEIGNEVFGTWEIGHTDAATYARNVNRYVRAMRAVDPGIVVIAVGSEDIHWNRELIRTAGANIDQIAIHHYFGDEHGRNGVSGILDRPAFYGQFYAQMRQTIHELSPSHPIRLNINEWNLALPLSWEESMLSGLYAGLMMNEFERNSDLIESSAISDMVNGWMGGIIQSAADRRTYVTPAYLVNRLYNEHLGSRLLRSRVSSAVPDAAHDLDVVAATDQNGKELILKIVNRNITTPGLLRVRVSGASVDEAGRLSSVTGPTLDVVNDFAHPSVIRENDSAVSTGNEFTVPLPKASVSVLTIPLHSPQAQIDRR